MAEAERRTAEDEVTIARDKAIQDVWKAYTDVRLALRKVDVSAALVDASQKSYDAGLEANRRGLGTLTDLLAARRDLSHAPTAQFFVSPCVCYRRCAAGTQVNGRSIFQKVFKLTREGERNATTD